MEHMIGSAVLTKLDAFRPATLWTANNTLECLNQSLDTGLEHTDTSEHACEADVQCMAFESCVDAFEHSPRERQVPLR